MNFDQLNLNERIVKALTLCGYTQPTSIQERAIPEILNGKDVVGCAQTGTGKTAAFVLPALNHIISTPPIGKPRVLILSPTRELATQITDAVSKYGKFLHLNIATLLGGMPYHKQMQALSRPVDVVIATPGRLMDHMERGRIDLSGVQMLILDEADRMLDMGFIDDVNHIASHMTQDRQTLLFSATVDKRLTQVINKLLKNPTYVDLSNEKLTPAEINQELYYADNPQHKMELLKHILANNNIFKAIIFSATKANADRLADELEDLEYATAALHGDLRQNVRNKTLDRLRRGKLQLLVATDVAARGIDISDITHVFNYDLPKFSEDYVHRIGRTGRAGKLGTAISLALPSDQIHVQRIERYIGQKLVTNTIPGLEPKKKPKLVSHGQKSNGGQRGGRSFGGERSSGFGKKKTFSKERSYDTTGGQEKSFKSKPSRFRDSASKYENAFNDKAARFGEENKTKPSQFKERTPRFDDSRKERTPRFDDSRKERAPRFDSSRKEGTPRFDDSRKERTPRFDDSRKERAPRFDSSRKEGATPRFDASRKERAPRFDSSRKEGATPRFDASRKERAPRFDDSRKERAPRFDDSRKERAPRFDSSRKEGATPRFDASRKERAPRFDSSRKEGTPRFDDSRKERAPRFDSSRKEGATPRFDASRKERTPRFDDSRREKPVRFKEGGARRDDSSREKPARFGDDRKPKTDGFKNKRFEKSGAPKSFKKKDSFGGKSREV